jgi:hypothetical protein
MTDVNMTVCRMELPLEGPDAAVPHSCELLGMADLYRVSERISAMKPSATAAVTDKAIELRQQGKDIISLSVGEPDFAPPDAVVRATGAAATDGHTRYTAVAGTHELRLEIARYLSEKKGTPYTAEQVLVSSGGKQSLVQVIMGMCGPGDDVIVPAPHWVTLLCSACDPVACLGRYPLLPRPLPRGSLPAAHGSAGALAGQLH